MSKRWNQWQAKNLSGKNDDTQLNALVAYLAESHGIPREQIHKDSFITIRRTDWGYSGPYEYLTEQTAKGCIIHRPDLILTKEGHIRLVIELDGSVHDHSGKRKTAMRNDHYATAGIPHLIINIADCAESGISWFEILDRGLKKYGVLVP